MPEENEVIPTSCTDWTLNIDAETQKQFWWNATYSLSIWQCNVNIKEPFKDVDDFVVWQAFTRYQVDSVYKLCPICKGPEMNEDMKVCCYCGSTVHVDCSIEASAEQMAWKPANKGLEEHLRVCKECEDINKPPYKPIKQERSSARRGAKRALTMAAEYPTHIKQELHRIVKQCDKGVDEKADIELMETVQKLLQSYFQPHNSHENLEKRPIENKCGGLGVVAKKDIPRFTIIGVYPGYEDPLSGEQAKLDRPGPRYSLVDLNCADYFNDVFLELHGTFTPFINEPNEMEFSNVAWIQETTKPEGRLSVMSVRDIKAGEELLIGYGPLYPRTYPYKYDAYAYHLVEGFSDPPCFALWHWTSLEEADSKFVAYCGYDKDTDTYTYWETEDEVEDEKEALPSKIQLETASLSPKETLSPK